MMTLDEAIKHCEEVADNYVEEYMEHPTRLWYIEEFIAPKSMEIDTINLPTGSKS